MCVATETKHRHHWWHLHLLSYAVGGLLIAALVTLNLPLSAWADSTANDMFGTSSMWDGWPGRWYYVVATSELSIKEVELRTLSGNVALLGCLLVATVAAAEFLLRELSRMRYINTSFFLALISTICTIAALRSNDATHSMVFHRLVFMAQEIALLIAYTCVLICWLGVFRWAASHLGRPPKAGE